MSAQIGLGAEMLVSACIVFGFVWLSWITDADAWLNNEISLISKMSDTESLGQGIYTDAIGRKELSLTQQSNFAS